MSLWVVYGLKSVNDVGFRYVGKTTWGAAHRLSQHLSDARRRASSRYVVNWINSVGCDSVQITVLEECPLGNKEYLSYAEKYWISSLKELGHKLTNLSTGGEGTSGYRMTEVTKRRLSESRRKSGIAQGDRNPRFGIKGELHPHFSLKGADHPGYGYRHSPEQIEKIRAAATGRGHTAETKAKLSAAHKGKPKSEETKLKLKHSAHLVHHVKRDIINERCVFCIPTTVSK